ncbi:MAG: hypothetical protein NVSMB64_26620 [Candidatus Velthaea sp.]
MSPPRWRLECASNTGTLLCQALDRVSLSSTNGVLGAVSVQLENDAKTPAILVQVPLGIAIANAVRVGTKSGPGQTLSVVTCTREGCLARRRRSRCSLPTTCSTRTPMRVR